MPGLPLRVLNASCGFDGCFGEFVTSLKITYPRIYSREHILGKGQINQISRLFRAGDAFLQVFDSLFKLCGMETHAAKGTNRTSPKTLIVQGLRKF